VRSSVGRSQRQACSVHLRGHFLPQTALVCLTRSQLLLPALPSTVLTSFFFFFLGYWGLSSGPPPLFVMGIFEIGSLELFTRAGFEP
jgi:hypothetical protein